MKKIVLFLFLSFAVNSVFSQIQSLDKRSHAVNKLLKQIADHPDFKTAGFAFFAIDINSGETIAEMNPDMALKPASTLKLLTTATVLELLGPDYQFKTILEYSGKIDTIKHFLNGNIIIKGGGDPTLGSKYFESTKKNQFIHNWANAVSSLKIYSINGRVIADAQAYSLDIVPSTWTWQNMGNYYGAGACGLSVYDNYYTIYFNTGKFGDKVEIVKLVPDIPNMVFDNAVTADSISYDNAYIFGAPYSYNRYLRGELPLNKTDFKVKGSIPDPAYIAALQLDSRLKSNKIGIRKSATTMRILKNEEKLEKMKRTAFHTILSPKLSEIIAKTNIYSINLFAEHCLIQAGIKLGSSPETDSSIDSVFNFWTNKGMDTQGLSLYDGSGLSMYNAVTTRQMVFFLKYMKLKSKYFDTFYNSLAIAGKTGTLRKMFKGSIAKGELRAKSGTVSRTKAFTGYVKSKSGREIAFSMMVNNYSCSSRKARAKLEQLMIALAEFNK